MKRGRLPLILIAVLVIALAAAVAWADDKKEEKKEEAQDIKKMSGKELYKAYCKHCHDADSPHGEYAPMTLIQEQWERFFDEDYVEIHKEIADSIRGGDKITESITEKMLEKIIEFCRNHQYINEVVKSVGEWQMEAEMEVRDFKHFNEIMEELKMTFPDLIIRTEPILLHKEYKDEFNFIEYQKI